MHTRCFFGRCYGHLTAPGLTAIFVSAMSLLKTHGTMLIGRRWITSWSRFERPTLLKKMFHGMSLLVSIRVPVCSWTFKAFLFGLARMTAIPIPEKTHHTPFPLFSSIQPGCGSTICAHTNLSIPFFDNFVIHTILRGARSESEQLVLLLYTYLATSLRNAYVSSYCSA